MLIDDKYAESLLEDARYSPDLSIPEYAYDVHTLKGKKMGKTKEDFFREEHNSLEPFQPGLFDGLVN